MTLIIKHPGSNYRYLPQRVDSCISKAKPYEVKFQLGEITGRTQWFMT